MIRRVRRVSAKLGRFAGVVVDLMGPRYRLGRMDAPRTVEKGQTIVVGSEGAHLPIGNTEVLDELQSIAPVVAVRGNMDTAEGLRELPVDGTPTLV